MINNIFKNTEAALKEYDLDATRRQNLWDSVDSNEDVSKAEKEEEVALTRVRKAFYEDTKDVNSMENCLQVTYEFMRRCVVRAKQ